MDANGRAYVAGRTNSTDFPTKNPFQSSLAGLVNGFLSKLTADGSDLVYSTFLGGTDVASISALAVDGNGAAYVTGTTDAPFPLLHPIQAEFLATSVNNLPHEVFVTAFDNTGSALRYSTFLGGFDLDGATTIGVDAGHNVYIGGAMRASGPTNQLLHGFPIINANNGLFQPFFSALCVRLACGMEPFIAKISPNSGTALASPSGVNFATVPKGTSSFPVAILIADVGSTDLTINNTSITGDYSISNNTCAGALLSAKHCEVGVVFSPTSAGTRIGVLTLTSNAPDSPRNIQLTGIGGVPVPSLNPTSLSLTSPSVGTDKDSRAIQHRRRHSPARTRQTSLKLMIALQRSR